MSEFEDVFGEWGQRSDGTPKSLSVRTYAGTGALGDIFTEPRSLPGLPQFNKRRKVINSNGDEQVAEGVVYAPLEHADLFLVSSLVTLDNGAERPVLELLEPDVFGLLGFVLVRLG